MRQALRRELENSIRDLSCLRESCYTAYDLIAAHGKTSERIDQTKRSGGTRMGTDEREGERGQGREGNGRTDGAVGGKGARGFEAG